MSEGLKSPIDKLKTKGRLSKAFDIFLTALVIIIAGVTAYVMIVSRGGKNVVSIFGRSVLVVVTGSMEPTIHEGDYIEIKRTDPSSLKVGDIITFVSNDEDIKGELVTHRIVGINDDGSFLTRGDANPIADSAAVRAENIKGRYVGRVRALMMISSFASPKKLLLVFGIIPLLIVSVYETRTLMKLLYQSRNDKRESDDELKQRLIREEIEKEKQRLREEGFNKEDNEEVKPDEPRNNNET